MINKTLFLLDAPASIGAVLGAEATSVAERDKQTFALIACSSFKWCWPRSQHQVMFLNRVFLS
jgi:hypothetical protein